MDISRGSGADVLDGTSAALFLDLEDFSGWLLRGTVEEFAPHQNPEAYARICHGFAAGNWGKPSRVFRFVPDALEPLSPVT